MPRAASMRERPHRVPNVEREHLRAGVAPKLGREHPEQHRFAGTRLPEHEGMPHVRIVEVDAERRGPRRRRPEEGRTLERKERRRVRGEPGPDARDRQEVGDVARGHEGTPEVRVAVPREAAEIGVQRIHGLDPPREPGVVQGFQDLPRHVVRAGSVGLHHDRDLGEGAEPHRPARVLGQGVRGILRQAARVLIEPERVVRPRGGVPSSRRRAPAPTRRPPSAS